MFVLSFLFVIPEGDLRLLVFVLSFLSVIPEGDLLLLVFVLSFLFVIPEGDLLLHLLRPSTQNARICPQYPSKFLRISLIESPPNLSIANLATVNATIASAATPAAGTTHTSLRS